jgi:hypothetical protein
MEPNVLSRYGTVAYGTVSRSGYHTQQYRESVYVAWACNRYLSTYVYTAPCLMFLMRADPLRGQVGGGWALEIESFLGPVK